MRLKTSFQLESGAIARVADFQCRGNTLAATLYLAEAGTSTGMIVVGGGPQYRVGGHRQFVELAERAALAGYPTLVFDRTGRGDSEGSPLYYFNLESDIRAAVDTLVHEEPAVRKVVLWGLCDGATACALYALRDSRVTGMILVNPWLEPTRRHAQLQIRDYYAGRLRSVAFWSDLIRGRKNAIAAIKGVLRALGLAIRSPRGGGAAAMDGPSSSEVATALAGFAGSVHILLSEKDVTARAFARDFQELPEWRLVRQRANVSRRDVDGADHTFSRQVWNEEMLSDTVNVLKLESGQAHCVTTPGGSQRAVDGPESP